RQLGEETTRILIAAEEAAAQLRQRAEEEARAELEAARNTATSELDTARRSAAEELQHARRTAAEELQQARRTAAEELDQARRTASEELDQARRTANEELEQARRTSEETVASTNRHREEVAEIVRELEEARQRLAEDLEGAVQSVQVAVTRLRSGPLEEAAAAALAAAEEATRVEAPGPGPAMPAEGQASGETAGSAPGVVQEDSDVALADEATEVMSPPVTEPSVEEALEPTESLVEAQATAAEAAAPSFAPSEDVDVVRPAEAEAPAATMEAAEAPSVAPREGVGAVAVDTAPLEETVEARPERETPAEPGGAAVASHELRDQALAGVRPGMLRRLKRTLQDVQNGVVDALRRSDGQVDPSELPPFADDLAPLGSIGEAFLAEAYRTGIGDGATLAGVPRREDAADPSRVDDAARAFRDTLAYEIDASLEATLRAGIEAGEETSMLIERVDSIFRDLKGPVSEAAVDASLVRVYELGLQDLWRATGVESRVWVVGEEQRCPENRCRLNAEQGPVALDEQFPSGDYVPPAHPGCTCTIAPG
ncbi:MAG: hypothetical protein M3133_03980, partial [Actinomycetota bacterium]|nr:hypothetical protein [Actinomycetota bacterium]